MMVCGPSGSCRKHTLIMDGPLLDSLLHATGLQAMTYFHVPDIKSLCSTIELITEQIAQSDCSTQVYDLLLKLSQLRQQQDIPAVFTGGVSSV